MTVTIWVNSGKKELPQSTHTDPSILIKLVYITSKHSKTDVFFGTVEYHREDNLMKALKKRKDIIVISN
jgi:hypothetical protein